MCRLLALPPGTSVKEALEAIESLENSNKDGVGTGYIDASGKPVINKAPVSATQALKDGLPLFNHLPHDGWTIAHTRFKTHGEQEYKNTHPFLIGDYIFAHNGVWSDSALVRIALAGLVDWQSDTDSEVAGWLFNRDGPEQFSKYFRSSSVFMGLHIPTGQLHVVKSYGDLQWASIDPKDNAEKPEGKLVVASEIDWGDYRKNERVRESESGVLIFDKTGTAIKMPGSRKIYPLYQGSHGYSSECYGGRKTTTGSHSSHQASSSCGLPIVDLSRRSIMMENANKKVASTWTLDPDDYILDLVCER